MLYSEPNRYCSEPHCKIDTTKLESMRGQVRGRNAYLAAGTAGDEDQACRQRRRQVQHLRTMKRRLFWGRPLSPRS